jgi:NAD(P)-dependent dehydrogenase (short-subunit alcohol dehydrogenase family)
VARLQERSPHLCEIHPTVLIITTSVASFRNQPWVGTPYMAAKAGAAHLVRQMALELARYNITVNSIAPGAFATNIGGGRLGVSHPIPLDAATPRIIACYVKGARGARTIETPTARERI